MPILANALIDAQKNKIQLAATDLEVGVDVEGKILKPGALTV